MSEETPPPEGAEVPPDEEELQRRLEEQLRKVRVQDLLLESVASILNLSARRISKADERDLEQGRIGIDAVRAVVDLLEPEPLASRSRGALAGADDLRARGPGRRTGGCRGTGLGAPARGARRPSARAGCGPRPAPHRRGAPRYTARASRPADLRPLFD